VSDLGGCRDRQIRRTYPDWTRENAAFEPPVFTVSRKAYAQFLARLDEPPKPNERLRRTMLAAPPWE
jgi:Protein of unknown function (DUF1778)